MRSCSCCIFQAVGRAIEVQVLQHGQVVVQAEALGHVPDPRPDFGCIPVHFHAQHVHFARSRFHQPQHHADGSGFARAVRAQEAEDFTGVDFKVDVIHGGKIAEALGEGVCENCRLRFHKLFCHRDTESRSFLIVFSPCLRAFVAHS